MPARLISLVVACALFAALVAALSSLGAGCYDVPRPDCGFRCGPAGECPDGYDCAAERFCHRVGTPDTLRCAQLDAAVPDAKADAAPDAMIDAAPDAMIDAPP